MPVHSGSKIVALAIRQRQQSTNPPSGESDLDSSISFDQVPLPSVELVSLILSWCLDLDERSWTDSRGAKGID